MPVKVPPTRDQLRELEVLVQSRQALVFVETIEEDRLGTLLDHVADRLGLARFTWSLLQGLVRSDASGPVHGTEDPVKCLAFIEKAEVEAIYDLRAFGNHLAEPFIVARLKEVHRQLSSQRALVVMTGSEASVPREIEPLITHFDLAPLSTIELHQFLSSVLRDIRQRMPVSVEMSSAEVTELLRHLKGLTLFEVKKVVAAAVVEDGILSRADLDRVLAAKKKIIERSGVLEYFPSEEKLADIAGLQHLKDWLRKRGAAFSDPNKARAFGLSAPKGLLLLGVQGCGKSLCAKAVASEWGLPLIRLDPSNLYQKYFGESEKNLKRAIRTAESMAPIVLWIDEMEKAFGQGGSDDGGTSKRVFGTFLTWLQEKKEDVFVIATANDISGLPPELLRKGRFDEIFFVDLPDAPTRASIFTSHLTRRSRDAVNFDTERLAAATDGFSGAEIEQVVVSALYSAFAEGAELTTDAIEKEIAATRPLSVVLAERIATLRAWARARTVPAG